jgi:O-antigen/teichoic acid export membrane protein
VVLLCTLGVVLINTRYIGTEAQGTASLISLGILLIVSLSNFIGGGAVVYLHSRMSEGQTILPALIWAVISSSVFFIVFKIVPIVPEEFIWQTCILGFIQSVFIFFLQILLGRQQVNTYNLIIAIQAFSQLLGLAFFIFIMNKRTSDSFISSLIFSFSITLLLSLFYNRHEAKRLSTQTVLKSARQLFSYGKFAQGGNILHLLNQRLNLVFLENMLIHGRSQTGIYAIALYMAEGIWTIAKSLSVIQYALIANNANEAENHQLTQKNLKASILLATFAGIVIAIVPSSIYSFVFRQPMEGFRMILLLLLPGILANSINIILAHYFSGKGEYFHNLMASAIGLAFGILTALVLIPRLSVQGAAISASCAFTAQCIYFVIQYKKAMAPRLHKI